MGGIGKSVLASALALTKRDLGEWDRGLLGLAAGLVPAAAGIVHYRVERRGLSEQQKRYERMRDLYRRAGDQLEKLLEGDRLEELLNAGRNDEARRLLRDLGLDALIENADWVLLHRDRPVSVPSP